MIKCSIKVYFNYFFIENSWKATRNIKKLTHCKRVIPGISVAKLSNQNIALLFWSILEIPLPRMLIKTTSCNCMWSFICL